MSEPTNAELDLELTLLPAWAKQSTDTNRYANFRGDEGARPERGRDDRRGPRAGGFGAGGGGRGGFGGERRGPRPEGRGTGGPGGARRDSGGPGMDRGPRGPRRDDRPGGRGDARGDQRGGGRFTRPERDLPPLPELTAEIIPERNGAEALARQIKLTGRAYPLFDVAALVMKRPERYHVRIGVVKKEDGTVAQPLFLCSLDQTVWLSMEEAVSHLLRRHFDTFYQAEKTPCDPPKGSYTLVAQCGMSGVILGPPNYHDYQAKLAKLHSERFARVPFDMFKSRVSMVRDEAVVKQWVEEQSFKTEFVALNVPEPLRFDSRAEVEKHFRETHAPHLVQQVTGADVPGSLAVQSPSVPLRALVRRAVDEQQRFPMKVANRLSGDFAKAGLQFFKVNKHYVHVSCARPHHLDMEATPVSDGVRKIIEFLDAHPKCTRKMLLEGLLPASALAGATAPAVVAAKPAAPAETSGVSSQENPGGEGAVSASAEASAAPAAETAPVAGQPAVSPEAGALIGDLHWLIHEGHVIEFASGQIETAKRPGPRLVQGKKDRANYLPVFMVAPLLIG